MSFPSSSRPSSSTNHSRSTLDAQQIPVEIFQQILENVPRNTLTNAARANTSFKEVSEKLLYRQVELTSAEQANQCFQSIEKKPSAAQSVREVIIMIQLVLDVYHPFSTLTILPIQRIKRNSLEFWTIPSKSTSISHSDYCSSFSYRRTLPTCAQRLHLSPLKYFFFHCGPFTQPCPPLGISISAPNYYILMPRG